MQLILDIQTICIGEYIVGATEAQGKVLCHVLCTGPSKQESSAVKASYRTRFAVR